MKVIPSGVAFFLLFVLSDFAPQAAGAPGRNAWHARFDLRRSCAGWQAGFADYWAGQEPVYELRWECGNESTNPARGFFIAGSNRSDDLFMFIKRPIDGLKPRTPYRVSARVEFLSRAPRGCLGIGGDPGANVYVKFGATTVEPTPIIAANGQVRMNVDIGNQSNSGSNAVVIGNIATSITDCHNEQYEAKALQTPEPLLTQTDPNGRLWTFVGTDSGFEGRTSLVFTEVQVHILPFNAGNGRLRKFRGQ
jgi:hypothetical protein